MNHHTIMNGTLHHVVLEYYQALKPIPTDLIADIPPPGSLEGVQCVLFDIYGTLLVSGAGEVGTAMDEEGLKVADLPSILKLCGMGVNEMSDHRLRANVEGTLTSLIQERHRSLRQEGVDFPEIDIRRIWSRALEKFREKGLVEFPSESSLSRDMGERVLEELALRYEMSQNPVGLMPGFPQIVEELGKRGYVLGIVSNAQFFTPIIVEALCGRGIVELGFEHALCCWSCELGLAKPSPLMFRPALECLENRGIEPDGVLYVGNDMRNDVSTAQQCGCRAALFAGDRRSLRLREGDPADHCRPELTITNLNQLLEILT